ncbi:MAG: hypothetical protein Q9187_002873 [Circinaria calcarea]
MPADLIIGVDLGMTYTGVAFFINNKTDPDKAKLIQKWPGKDDKTENKVPTSLLYDGKKLKSWGFLCDRLDQEEHSDPQRQQYFKLWLDRQHLEEVFDDGNKDNPSHEDVKKWFTDFLKKLHLHIKRTFSQGPYEEDWNSKVDFVFSIPTTWKSQHVFETYRKCIHNAGFGANMKKHKAYIGLTEAEAAAIHTLNSQGLKYRTGDIILVCDAGGGTTDAALLEVVDQTDKVPQLKQYGVDCGKPVGSVNIDENFIKIVTQRLKKVEEAKPSIADDDPDWAVKTASAMARSDFQYYKCAFGTTEGTHEKFKVKIPDFPSMKSFPDAFIEKKHMLFTRPDMSGLFDEQLFDIYSIIDDQMNHLKKTKKEVNHLVLSGGLGSSLYVKKKLTERYVNNIKAYPHAKNLKIHTADDPYALPLSNSPQGQTAVVQGLVINHAQKREHGTAVLKSRTCPASYGVLHQTPYDEVLHTGMKIERDPLDNAMYAVDVIQWFVKKGDQLSENTHKSYNFMRKISPSDKLQNGQWKSTVVISWKDVDYLPKALGDGAKILCTIKSDTSHLKLRDLEKVPEWHYLRTAYFVARYEIRVIIEVANILFEVWYDGRKISKDQLIDIKWMEGAETSRRLEEGSTKDILVGR